MVLDFGLPLAGVLVAFNDLDLLLPVDHESTLEADFRGKLREYHCEVSVVCCATLLQILEPRLDLGAGFGMLDLGGFHPDMVESKYRKRMRLEEVKQTGIRSQTAMYKQFGRYQRICLKGA